MQTRQLGNSDLHITRVGFGAWAIGGGGWEYAWGAQDDRESIAAIHHALDLGINWIDTAPVYGLGHSEQVVAQALKTTQHKPYIFTKCELVWDDHGKISGSMKAASLRREIEASLRRLAVDVIDLYQIHWPDPDEEIEEGWQTLIDIQAQGKVRYIAVSNFSVAQMQRAMQFAPITSLQPPYSLVKPQVQDEILPFCGQHNIGVIVYSPMYSGLLTGAFSAERLAGLPEDDWRKRDDEFQPPRLERNLRLVALLTEIGQQYGRTPGEVAIAWTLHHPAVTAAIVGARRPAQIDGFIHAADITLSAADLGRLEAFIAAHP
ncbi:MAG: aldo/keto reductase [Anaerolineae bacterium]|nr:aldo/keto reductase [Anaerolineae bacterium]